MREFEKETEESVTAVLAKRDFTKDLSAILNDRGKFVFPGADKFAMCEPQFNDRGDLQLDLRLKGDEIVFDDTFRLIVNAEGLPHHKQWVKVVTIDAQTWKAVLAKGQSGEIGFQLVYRNLVVNVEGMPIGSRARPRETESESVMRQVVFEYRDGVKCELSITGFGIFSFNKKALNPKTD